MYLFRIRNYEAIRNDLVTAIAALEAHEVDGSAAFTDALVSACERLQIEVSTDAVTALQTGYDSLNA